MARDNRQKDKNEPPVIFKYYGLFAFLGFAIFAVCMGVGLSVVGDWLVFVGLGICLADFVTLIVTRTVWETKKFNREQKEKAERERESALKEKANYAENINESKKADEIRVSAAERIADIIEIDRTHGKLRRKMRRRPRGDGKWKAVLLLTYFGFLILSMLIGCGLANFTYIGFILMGISGGGFFLMIFALIIKSAIDGRASKRHVTSSDTVVPLRVDKTIYKGAVVRCEMHSQNVTGEHRLNESTTLFKVWVDTDRNGKRIRLKFICPHRYVTGDTVYFVGDIRKPKKCKLLV